MYRFLILALFAGLLPAQTTERAFLLKTPSTQREFNDLVAAALAASGAWDVSRNSETHEIRMGGTTAQLAAAEWVLAELDRPPAAEPPVTKRNTLEGDDHVSIFYLDRTGSEQGFNELQTAIRTLTDIRYVGPLASRRALALRGTADQLDFAA